MRNKIIPILIALIILAGAVSAAISSTSFGTTKSASSVTSYARPSIQNYYADRLTTYYPILENADSCEARQDILLQVVPAGCQPAVVRSDLLAEQNVPVFCQLSALKVNPLIDIKQIRNIRFGSKYPEGVLGVGFHPAKAALRTQDILLGSPLTNNIGYIVVVLKKNPVEKTLPDFVNLTLSAQLEYYADNALGIGKTEFLLSPVSEEEWKTEQIKQSFFNGQYSARLEEANSDFATVSIYHGDRKVSTTKIIRGKSSSKIFLPGSYCRVSLTLSYADFVSADKTAIIQIDDEKVEVQKGSKFLNNKCTVKDMKITDETKGTITLTCGSETFPLSIQPNILSNGDDVRILESGNEVWQVKETKENQYILSRSGEADKTIASNQLIPISPDKLIETSYNNPDLETYFKKAEDSAVKLVNNYPAEKDPNVQSINTKRYGEEGLSEAIELAETLKKQVTQLRLIDKFLETYPDSVLATRYTRMQSELFTKDISQAGKLINVDNQLRTIRLSGFKIPEKKSNADFSLDTARINIEEGSSCKFNSGGGCLNTEKSDKSDNSFILNSIDTNAARITYSCAESGDKKAITNKAETITLDESKEICGRIIKLESTNIEKLAKIKINPSAEASTETNLTVAIGIEKRAIQLSPSKTNDKIKNLNESIKKWESISNNLGKVVSGLKAACFGTTAVLTVKNFFTGLSGEALARQTVMRGPNGWSEKCKTLIDSGSYTTLTQCYNAKAGEINKDVEEYAKAQKQVNTKIKDIEKNHQIQTTGFFGGTAIDRDKAAADLLADLRTKYPDKQITLPDGKTAPLSSLIDENSYKNNQISYEQLRDTYTDILISDSQATEIGKARAAEDLKTMAGDIQIRKENTKAETSLVNSLGLSTQVKSYSTKGELQGEYYGNTWKNIKDKTRYSQNQGLENITDETPIEIISYGGAQYVITLLSTGTNKEYAKQDVYKIEQNNQLTKLSKEDSAKIPINNFQKLDSNSYNNKFNNPKVIYYERDPYKGMPALVPFDTQQGWYVATKQTSPGLGNIKVFESSGRPVVFWICNVGPDGNADFFRTGFNNDICRQFNLNTGQPLDKFPGLSEDRTKQIVNQAVQALNSAAEQYGKGKVVRIGREALEVGNPGAVIPASQCQDFMSPGECKLLFNVCDPVICPSSRCDFGGAYPVADVVQTGVIGSALLCLPNAKEGIAVPVCLTGIKAGLDGYVSILKSHRDCLQENLDTGKTTGICDEITSIYTCEFFWKQAAPLANIALPKIFEFLTGNTAPRGGGEYLSVQASWQNAQDSAKYFTQTYAANAIEAFNIRSVEEAGTPICKNFISLTSPKSFKALVEPESPSQFHAWFSSTPFTDATVPATSQYKVFYHIFSGKDRGTAYSVYLKEPEEGSFYSIPSTVIVASGFIPKGQYKTETKDFTAPLGYKQLCVRINEKEECGFKQVSTSFAINYLRNQYVSDEIKRTDIATEKACISGSPNPNELLQPNIQAGVESTVNPQIYNRGVIRICSTDNPGLGTEPTRFVEAGYCDDKRVKCWLDTNSVDNSLSSNIKITQGIKNETLSSLKQTELTRLKELEKTGEVVITNADDRIDELFNDIDETAINSVPETKDIKALEDKISDLESRLYLNSDKAKLLLRTTLTYIRITSLIASKSPNTPTAQPPAIAKTQTETTTQPPASTPTETKAETIEIKLDQPYKQSVIINLLDNQENKIQVFLTEDRVMHDGFVNIRIGHITGNENNFQIILDKSRAKMYLTENQINTLDKAILTSDKTTITSNIEQPTTTAPSSTTQTTETISEIKGISIFINEKENKITPNPATPTFETTLEDKVSVKTEHTCDSLTIFLMGKELQKIGDSISSPLTKTLDIKQAVAENPNKDVQILTINCFNKNVELKAYQRIFFKVVEALTLSLKSENYNGDQVLFIYATNQDNRKTKLFISGKTLEVITDQSAVNIGEISEDFTQINYNVINPLVSEGKIDYQTKTDIDSLGLYNYKNNQLVLAS